MEEPAAAVLQERVVIVALLPRVQKDTQQLILRITALHYTGAINPVATVPMTVEIHVAVLLENAIL